MPLVAAFYLACALVVCPSYTRAGALATVSIKTSRELMAALRDSRPEMRAAAEAAIARADSDLVADLLRQARTPKQREVAQRTIVRMGSKAVPTLIGLFDDSAIDVQAGSALFQVASESDHSEIPRLLSCAESKPNVKNYCATTLFKISGPKAAAHVPALGACLRKGASDIRPYCAGALGRIGAKAALATDDLVAALVDASPETRLQAIVSLGLIGGGAVKAAPALRKALKDPSAEVRKQAKTALRRIGA